MLLRSYWQQLGLPKDFRTVAEADKSSKRVVEEFLAWKHNRSHTGKINSLNLERTINVRNFLERTNNFLREIFKTTY